MGIRIDAGDPKGAVRILLNDGRIVQPDEKTLIQLGSKHLTEPDPKPATTDLAKPMRLTSEQLREAIYSTRNGGAPEPDGLRPCHLKQICGPSARGEQENIMTCLLAFCNVCIGGKVPPGACSLFWCRPRGIPKKGRRIEADSRGSRVSEAYLSGCL